MQRLIFTGLLITLLLGAVFSFEMITETNVLAFNNSEQQQAVFHDMISRHKRSAGGCPAFCGGYYPDCRCG
ncbi:unnamed protein product [Adineta ricciae]|uniref:Uncharacterized protein n=1 Tax=Adineta ricciae TaxID=249248 RepID=A0A816DI15_ADIRI|nr:unnamed protein product [Adineta ricciae]CAF1635035.1 unnamed protein product [Adineta ricciae]